jgi:hypothetical protein
MDSNLEEAHVKDLREAEVDHREEDLLEVEVDHREEVVIEVEVHHQEEAAIEVEVHHQEEAAIEVAEDLEVVHEEDLAVAALAVALVGALEVVEEGVEEEEVDLAEEGAKGDSTLINISI